MVSHQLACNLTKLMRGLHVNWLNHNWLLNNHRLLKEDILRLNYNLRLWLHLLGCKLLIMVHFTWVWSVLDLVIDLNHLAWLHVVVKKYLCLIQD